MLEQRRLWRRDGGAGRVGGGRGKEESRTGRRKRGEEITFELLEALLALELGIGYASTSPSSPTAKGKEKEE